MLYTFEIDCKLNVTVQAKSEDAARAELSGIVKDPLDIDGQMLAGWDAYLYSGPGTVCKVVDIYDPETNESLDLPQ